MLNRSKLLLTTIFLLVAVSTTFAVDYTLSAKLNGRLFFDSGDGDITSELDDGGIPRIEIIGDGDPRYLTRYRADIFFISDMGNDCFGNIAFTLNDVRYGPAYNYALEKNPATEYYTNTFDTSRRPALNLYEVNFTKLNVAANTDVTLGAYKVRYGDGGYYNDFVNGVDPHAFVSTANPYGIRIRRDFGLVGSEIAVGVDDAGALFVGTKQTIGTFNVYVTAEARTYRLKTLWDVQFLGSMSDYWLNRYMESGEYGDPSYMATGNSVADTIHAGVDIDLTFGPIDVYPLFAFHNFADSGFSDAPSGGYLMQMYGEIAARPVPGHEEITIRAAALYEMWKANESDLWYNDGDTNADLMFWVEPQLELFDGVVIGGNFRYKNPSMNPPTDNENTPEREDQPLSISYGPHIRWTPANNTFFDFTYTMSQWDSSYDYALNDEFDNSKENKVKMEIEMLF